MCFGSKCVNNLNIFAYKIRKKILIICHNQEKRLVLKTLSLITRFDRRVNTLRGIFFVKMYECFSSASFIIYINSYVYLFSKVESIMKISTFHCYCIDALI